MEKIQELVIKKSWILQCFDDRYNRGVWSVLVPHINAAYQLHELLDDGDNKSKFTSDYLLDRGAWLPTTLGHNLMSSLELLELKVGNFEQDPSWNDDVYNACQLIMECEFLTALEREEPTLFRTGVVQPKGGMYFLKEDPDGLFRITIDKKTLKLVNSEFFHYAPHGWTRKDVEDLLEEGRRFFGDGW